jgi:hypothetical protein
MKEFILHSALMHYFTSNFYSLFKKEFTLIKQVKTISSNQDKGYLLNLPFYTIFQILSSNYLKVEIEDQVLSFIYHYTKRFIDHPTESAGVITDLLASTLRFCYLSLDKILSAIKDNNHLR